MPDSKELLRETRDRIAPPTDVLGSLERRRHLQEQVRRGSAVVVALVVALGGLGGWFVVGQDAAKAPIDDPKQPTPRPGGMFTPRRGGEFIVFTPRVTGEGWDLGAEDPDTGEVRTIVETAGIVEGVDECPDRGSCTSFIREAEWSADGRRVAFEVSHVSINSVRLGTCGPTVGIWVQGPSGVPRQLTRPCDALASGSNVNIQEMWEWSPVDDRLAYARIDGEADELFVIDASDGTRTSLVTGNIASGYPPPLGPSLTWSSDGSQIAYSDGSAVYAVDVESGERSLLSNSFDDIIEIAWSPDGRQILVHDQGRYRIQVMNADGSDLHVLLEGEDACCETDWSPDGDRILYMLSTGTDREGLRGRFDSEVWTASPDGSNRTKVFDSNGCDMGRNQDALPVWAPNGAQIAYNACGDWVVEGAEGSDHLRPTDELLWRSWYSGGLSQWDLAGIGQINR